MDSFWPVRLYTDHVFPTHEGKVPFATNTCTQMFQSSSMRIVTRHLIFYCTGCPVVQFHFYRLSLNRTKPFHPILVSTSLNTSNMVQSLGAYIMSYNIYMYPFHTHNLQHITTISITTLPTLL